MVLLSQKNFTNLPIGFEIKKKVKLYPMTKNFDFNNLEYKPFSSEPPPQRPR